MRLLINLRARLLVTMNPPPAPTAIELSELLRTWTAEFIPLPAHLRVPWGSGLKSALVNSTAVPPAPPRRGAASVGQFPSWEGSGVGWSAPGSWSGDSARGVAYSTVSSVWPNP